MSETTILVVEDEAIVAADLSHTLEGFGHKVIGTVSRGREAIEIARKERPDLVLMDIRLSGEMDGVEAADSIRKEYDVPVIYLTAHSDRATLQRAKVTEPFGYILKPYNEGDLENQIQMALYKHQAERRLREARDTLERRVRERTAELELSNKALSESEERLRLALDSAHLATWDWFVSSGRMIWDAELFRMLDYEPGTVTPSYGAWTDRVHPDDVAVMEESFRQALALGADFTSEFRVVWRDGTVMHLEALGRFQRYQGGRAARCSGVLRDVTQRWEAEEALRQSHRKLENEIVTRLKLEREVLEISEQERRRFGHDLHDDVCQQLAAIVFMHKTLLERLRKISPEDAEELENLSDLLGRALGMTRALARGLHPVEVESNGLMSALEELARVTNPSVPCRLECEKPVPFADSRAALQFYRIAQEAVNNALKHSGAREIVIGLHQENGCIELCVQDDGIGMITSDGTGMGMHIMPYRARMIGATLTVESAPNKGTRVVCSLQQSE